MPRLAKNSTLGPYPYRILRHIADGGTSSTYLASMDDDHSRKVVIKITPADHSFAEQALMNEMQHLRRLDHPGIVRRHRIVGQTLSANAMVDTARAALPGKPWFSVLEYLGGGSLEGLLKQYTKVPIGLALEIGAKVASALAYMHERDEVHLDLKPGNILFRHDLSESVEPVLIDFGIARGKGQTGLEGGTRAYCAPERLLAELDVSRAAAPDPAMDIYSLGVILFEMMLGKRPFEDRKERTTNAMMHSLPTRPSALIPDLSHDIDAILVQSLSRDPDERPTAAQMALRLRTLAESARYRDYEMPAYHLDSTTAPRTGGRLMPLVLGGVATALVAGGALFLPTLMRSTAPTPAVTPQVEQVVPVATETPLPQATTTEVPATRTVRPTERSATSTAVATFTPRPATETVVSTPPRATVTP